jgi:hypothetical protein
MLLQRPTLPVCLLILPDGGDIITLWRLSVVMRYGAKELFKSIRGRFDLQYSRLSLRLLSLTKLLYALACFLADVA